MEGEAAALEEPALSFYQQQALEARYLAPADVFASGMGDEAREYLEFAAGEPIVLATRPGERTCATVRVEGVDGAVNAAAIDVVAAPGSSLVARHRARLARPGRGGRGHAAARVRRRRRARGHREHADARRQLDRARRCGHRARRARPRAAAPDGAGSGPLLHRARRRCARRRRAPRHRHALPGARRPSSATSTTSPTSAGAAPCATSTRTACWPANRRRRCAAPSSSCTAARAPSAPSRRRCSWPTSAWRTTAVPVILCDEDDVAGNHGATIGHVAPKQLFYLASRGISPDDAERLFIAAAFEEAAIGAPDERTRAAVARLAAARGIALEEAVRMSNPIDIAANPYKQRLPPARREPRPRLPRQRRDRAAPRPCPRRAAPRSTRT